jgi:hypothetical protein
MTYLQRINYHPNTDDLSDAEKHYLAEHFDAYGAELVAHGQALPWQFIEEVEVAKAARFAGAAGWLVKNLVMSGERYHVGIYYGRQEIVFSNVTWKVAQYIVRNIAYYAPQSVAYKGPEDLVPLTEI